MPAANSNPGCVVGLIDFLAALLRGGKVQPPCESGLLPYKLTDRFLSNAELSFYHVLKSLVGDQVTICAKVRVADLIYVSRPNENQTYRNKIDRKHVDFVLCTPNTMHPLVAIELDDKSHQSESRQARDLFVDEVFKVAGLPLLHIPCRASYSNQDLTSLLEPYISNQPADGSLD